MSQTRSGDDLVGRIRLKIESAHVHAHLAGDGPNMHLVQCCGERLMIEAILKATQLIQFRNLPEDNAEMLQSGSSVRTVRSCGVTLASRALMRR
jgi:hypothetical protein